MACGATFGGRAGSSPTAFHQTNSIATSRRATNAARPANNCQRRDAVSHS
jgi:hypothetical protein